MSDHYILQDGQPVPCEDILEWGRWLETAERQVAHTVISADCDVSTVFLGLNHNFYGDGPPPILWETMIFGGEHDQYQERYASEEEARTGHARAVLIAQGIAPLEEAGE